jgi:hypothetical protein
LPLQIYNLFIFLQGFKSFINIFVSEKLIIQNETL